MARRSRALAEGSGRPALAATVISRDSLEKILDRILSCFPLRCMMFLNCEWPAMTSSDGGIAGCLIASGARARQGRLTGIKPGRAKLRRSVALRSGNDGTAGFGGGICLQRKAWRHGCCDIASPLPVAGRGSTFGPALCRHHHADRTLAQSSRALEDGSKALADATSTRATVKLARALTHLDVLATASTVQPEKKPGFLRRAR